jgi:hypothetical protein
METRTVELHRVQAAFRASRALYRGFVGGRGSGKSWVAAYDLIRRAKPKRLYMVAAPTYVVLRDSTLRTFNAIATDFGMVQPGNVRRSPPSCTLNNGAEIIFRSADDPERMRGPNLSGVVLDEASLMTKDAYDIAIACLREGGETGWLAASFTPKGLMHWTYEVFGTGKPNTELFRAKTKDNPFLPADFEQAIMEQYGEGTALAMQELEGAFVNLEGAEWPPQYFDGPGFWFDDWPPEKELTVRVVSLDPSKGTDAKTGDFQALIRYARDRNGVEYVECDMGRRPMVAPRSADGNLLGEGMVETFVDAIQQFKPHRAALETNQFQVLLKIPIDQELRRRNLEQVIMEVNNRDPKTTRIRRLGYPLSKRQIRFRNTRGTRLLVEQLKQFPLGEHDDGPDSLEQARRVGIELYNAGL